MYTENSVPMAQFSQLRKVALLAALLAASALAVNWRALKPEGYVNDYAQAMDPATEARLEAYCAQVEAATGVQLGLVTVPSLEGEPVEDAANALFRAWGIGSKQSNEGILLLLSIGDRRSRLEVGYGLEPILPDGLAGSVLREMRPALRQNQYGEALMAAAETLGETVARAKNVPLNAQLPRTKRPSRGSSIPWALLGGIVFFGLVLRLIVRRPGYGGYRGGGGGGGILPAILLGELMSRSTWGGQGGGGFGGYDSGDSFGGFGGGDSGGGGASGDW